MKLSPFSVSFDGPLNQAERRRGRIAAVALFGAILFMLSGGIPKLLNAGSGVLPAWTNGRPQVSTTGVGSIDDATNADVPVKFVLDATVSVQAEAIIAKPKREGRTSDTTAGVTPRQRKQPQYSRQIREPARIQDDAAVERRWRERAAEIERRAPRNDFLR
jgi:hypothetical protein